MLTRVVPKIVTFGALRSRPMGPVIFYAFTTNVDDPVYRAASQPRGQQTRQAKHTFYIVTFTEHLTAEIKAFNQKFRMSIGIAI
jgi:hypothetical protein